MPLTELSEAVQRAIEELSSEGDALAEDGEYQAAVATFIRALEMLPEPRNDWEASTWLLVAIGDANSLAKQWRRDAVSGSHFSRFELLVGLSKHGYHATDFREHQLRRATQRLDEARG